MQLPDGRVQLVTYSVADQAAGYVADVSYSGEAIHAPAVAQEQVSLLIFFLQKIGLLYFPEGEAGRWAPEARQVVRQAGGKTKQGGKAHHEATTVGHQGAGDPCHPGEEANHEATDLGHQSTCGECKSSGGVSST